MPTIYRLIGIAFFVAILASACAPAAGTPAPTEPAAATPTPPPPPPTPTTAPAIRELVDAEPVNALIETFLGFDPAYQDPRVDCAAMTGDGMVLGDSGQCIPMYPPGGFCIEGSSDHPCDVLLVASPGFKLPEGFAGIGGVPGYAFEMVTVDAFDQLYRPSAGDLIYQDSSLAVSAWYFLTAIPASSVDFFKAAQGGLPLPFVASPSGDGLTPPDEIRETVDAERVNHIIESMLALNPGYTDPRLPCEQMQGSGLIIGQTGLCLPQHSQTGFCIEGSSQAPCDMVLFAEYANYLWEGESTVGGRGGGYVLRFALSEEFRNEFPQYPEPIYTFSPLIPVWIYGTVIPASSTNIRDMQVGLGLIFAAAPDTP